MLYFKIMFIQMSDSASWVCTEAWKMGILSIFAEIDAFKWLIDDFKCIFHNQHTPALVILFQNINKDDNLCC